MKLIRYILPAFLASVLVVGATFIYLAPSNNTDSINRTAWIWLFLGFEPPEPRLGWSYDQGIALLKDGQSHVRAQAATALGELRDPRAVEPLIYALKDEDWRVQETAAWALGKIKDPRAVEPLIEALSHSIEVVRGNAAGALGEIRDPRAVEPLISALRDYVPHVRLMAAGALAAISDPRAIGPLAKQLEHEQDNDVRNSLTEAITKLESENVPEP